MAWVGHLDVQPEGSGAAPAGAFLNPALAALALQRSQLGPHAAPWLPVQSLSSSSGTWGLWHRAVYSQVLR